MATVKKVQNKSSPLDGFYIQPGLNIRDINYKLVAKFAFYYANKLYVPPLTVEETESGKMIVDGHHRFLGIEQAIAEGNQVDAPEYTIFTGTLAERNAFMIKSAEHDKLQPLERGRGYKNMNEDGKSVAEIAFMVGRSESDVTQMLQLMATSDYLKSLVAEKKINYSLAIALTRKYGADADQQAKNLLTIAEKRGKNKITGNIANINFSVTKSRRLVQLASDAELVKQDDKTYLLIPPEFLEEISTIINEYKQENSDATVAE